MWCIKICASCLSLLWQNSSPEPLCSAAVPSVGDNLAAAAGKTGAVLWWRCGLPCRAGAALPGQWLLPVRGQCPCFHPPWALPGVPALCWSELGCSSPGLVPAAVLGDPSLTTFLQVALLAVLLCGLLQLWVASWVNCSLTMSGDSLGVCHGELGSFFSPSVAGFGDSVRREEWLVVW